MEIFYFTAQAELDSFITSVSGGLNGDQAASQINSYGAEYLQAWFWGDICVAEGAEICRLGARDQKGIAAALTLTKARLAGGYSYWYAPRGPILRSDIRGDAIQTASCLDLFSRELRRSDSRVVFWRLEPAVLPARTEQPLAKTLDRQPARTLILDLGRNEAELLAGMHPKTRYNIHLAEKKGVTTRVGRAADQPDFWRLLRLTGERDGFRIHDARHYEKLLAAPDETIKLLLAEYGGRVIAAGLFCFWGGRATYLHGASDNEYRNAMAPYLLQWTAIRAAKDRGCRSYDFYGIDEKKWPGVTRFKLGFGGEQVNYPGTYDLILNPALYRVYSWLRRLRRLI
ncbi:MAG: peptidoglycan bridge formation glycyltransferase FemA/FemB family protein [Patescibacteria group bacterium]